MKYNDGRYNYPYNKTQEQKKYASSYNKNNYYDIADNIQTMNKKVDQSRKTLFDFLEILIVLFNLLIIHSIILQLKN